jgi:PST family polysaccharide transporter
VTKPAAIFGGRDFLNLSSLYGSLLINAVINLLLIGYLARVLEPQTWGMVLLAQALGYWLSLINDYGFTLSGGRAVAKANDLQHVSATARAIIASKGMLSLAIPPVAAAVFFIIPSFQAEPLFLVGGAVFAIAQGLDPIWLFQGLERQYYYAVVTSVSRALTLLAIFWLVQGPEDGWLVLFVQAAGALAIFLLGIIYMRRHLPTARVGLESIREALRMGWKVFQLRAAQSIGGTGLLILGTVSPRAVEAFGSAERIVRNCVGLLGPISAAGMPRIARLIGSDPAAARRTARLSFMVMTGLGLAMGAMMIVLAPMVVQILLGPGYEFVTPILQIASIAIPITSASGMVSVQWMLPLGLDASLVKITVAVGALNVVAFAVLGSLYGALGAVIAMVVVEAASLGGMVLALRRHGGEGFWSRGG